VHDQSFDHVVPLSKQGSHTPENVRLTHKICNLKKGDQLVSELNLERFYLERF
jgi:5-methylcytosine-specific restriction endonuclease McrA